MRLILATFALLALTTVVYAGIGICGTEVCTVADDSAWPIVYLTDSDCDNIADIYDTACPCDASNTCMNSDNLVLSKTVSKANPINSDIITYTITARNTGAAIDTVTMTDSIGDSNGVLTGTQGGTATFRGTESITATRAGTTYTQSRSGSIATAQGLTLTNIPANAIITITYQARIDTSSIGTGSTSTILNTVRTASTSATARIDMSANSTPNTGICGTVVCTVADTSVSPIMYLNDSDCDNIADIYEGACVCNPSSTCTSTTNYTLTKTIIGQNTYQNADTITYRITITALNNNAGTVTLTDSFTNNNQITQNGASITYIPASQTINQPTGTTASGTINTNGITFTNIRQSSGPVTITYQASVNTQAMTTTSTTITNTAHLSTGRTASTSATITRTTNTNNLEISKTVSNTNPTNANTITYTITARNNGATINTATITDTIGENNGILSGTRGGTATFRGTETITSTTNGASYTQSHSGSITNTQGITLTNIPPNAIITITYQTQIDTTNIGNGITSTILNTARTPSTSATARIDMTGSTTTGICGTAVCTVADTSVSPTVYLTDSDCDNIADIYEGACVCNPSSTCTSTTNYTLTKTIIGQNTYQNADTITYRITITALNNNAGTVTLTDSFTNNNQITQNGASITYIPASQTINLPTGTTASGTINTNGITLTNIRQNTGPVTITYQATVNTQAMTTTSTTITNTANLNTGRTASTTATITRTTNTGNYLLSKTIIGQNTYRNTDTIIYRATITALDDIGSSVTVTDSFTGGGYLTRDGATISYIPASQIVNLPSGASTSGTLDGTGIILTNVRQSTGAAMITYQATVNTQAMTIASTSMTNTAHLSTGETASATANIAATMNANNLALTKVVSNTNPTNADIITYTITARNNGATINTATITDSIGESGGTLTGTRGGTATFRGTESITASVAGTSYTQIYSGSIASTQGITLTNVPANGVIIITYQVRIDATSIGNGITSALINTVRTASTSATARIDITGSHVADPDPAQNDAPYILPIANQIQTCGAGFAPLNLNDYIGDPETPNNQLLVTVDGNEYLQVSISPTSHILVVNDPTGVQNDISENLRISVRDPEGLTTYADIRYTILRNEYDKPIISGIPDQIIENGDDFDDFNLNTYTQIGNQPVGNRTVNYYSTGSSIFDVIIDASGRVSIQYDENLFDILDVDRMSEELTFSVRGCSEATDTAVYTVMREFTPDIIPGYNPDGGQNTCVIIENNRQYQDTDCDDIPNEDDNCIDVKNPDQGDNNNDGIGDACDLIISCTPTIMTALDAGKTLSVLIEAQNNMVAVGSTTKYAAAITRLGVRDTKTLMALQRGDSGEATLKLRIPECTEAGTYTLTCSVTNAGHTSQETANIRIAPGTCTTTEGDSAATFFQTQDVIAGSEYGAAYPIEIKNDGDVQRTYMLTVDGIKPWGDYVFEEGGVVVVPAEQTLTTSLRVFAYKETLPDTYPFKVIMQSGDNRAETILQATIVDSDTLPGEQNGIKITDIVWLGLLVIVLGLIIFGAYRTSKK